MMKAKDDETKEKLTKEEENNRQKRSGTQVWYEECFDDSDLVDEQEETIHRYGLMGVDKLEKGFWKCLKNYV
ncbi:hypothetical protein Tco_0368704 [Tanacetum coccineum]